VQRLADLTRDLLDYGKPGALAIAACPIDDLLQRTVVATNAVAEAHGVTVAISERHGDAMVIADAPRILLVLQNLVLNAIQHAPPGTVVQIGASRVMHEETTQWRIDVSDRGPGFEPDALRRAFEPFFTRRKGGTGLGLAIAHRIVHDHGGTIWAANRPNGGAMVSFRLESA
jgi:signal transduction histidine kinase